MPRPARRRAARLVLALALAAAASPLLAAPPRLVLLLAESRLAGSLKDCSPEARPERDKPWRALSGKAYLAWVGGGTWLATDDATPAAAAPAALGNHCFRLELDGTTLVQGAVIPLHSARLLGYPVLVAENPGRGGEYRFLLSATWPPMGGLDKAWEKRLHDAFGPAPNPAESGPDKSW